MPPNPAGAGYPSSFLETDIAFTNYIYGYHYDQRNRVIQKKIPNKGWEYMSYNKLDQVVLSQDAVLRLTNQWIATKYDNQGRVIVTGLWPSAGQSQSDLQTIYNNAPDWAIWDSRDYTDNITGYKIVSYALPAQFLTINYYDDYTNLPGFPPDFIISGNSTMTKGLLTATKTLVLNTTYNSTLDMLCTAHYYDDLGRNVKTFQQHYLGGVASPYNYDVINSSYNFSNQDTLVTRQHYTGNTAKVLGVTVTNRYAYDHMGRKTQTFEKINSGTNILLSQTDYNPIGQVMAKHLHSATGTAPFLQDISYKYNERGWLKRINDPALAPTATRMFSEQLNYDSVRFAATPNFNGNIAEQMFQNYNSPQFPGQQHVVYTYDSMNRLNSGVSTTGSSETGISYDEIGNITSLTRNGNTGNYAYANNQLNIISGVTATPYTYDGNGNVFYDGRTGATVNYNLLNLPQTVADGANINITYFYDADGQKLRKVSTAGGVTTNTDYISGIQYTNGALAFIQTEEGRATNSAGNYTYEYTLTDHLGNNRVAFDQTNGKVGEEDYYPFGLNVHRQLNAGNKYLYNKKELQDELTEYDYGARFYDPVVGRFNTIDPFAEKYKAHTPYHYGLNDPISNIDLKGDSTIKGAGFWQNAWQGLKDGATDTKNFVKSLGTEEGWFDISLGVMTSNNNTLGNNVYNALSNIPNMNKDDWGHALGYGTEKVGESLLFSKGAGLAKNALTVTADLSEASILYHSTSSAGAASSILNEGINPAYFNSASRFGGGFYMSNDIATSAAELSYHGANVTNTIKFGLGGGSFLNATSPLMNIGVEYAPKIISGVAKGLGYDGIMYNSLRGTGLNVVQFKNFGLLTNGKLVP